MYTVSNILYVISILLGAIWAAGFFVYHAGNTIHIFLVIAIAAFVLKVFITKTQQLK